MHKPRIWISDGLTLLMLRGGIPSFIGKFIEIQISETLSLDSQHADWPQAPSWSRAGADGVPGRGSLSLLHNCMYDIYYMILCNILLYIVYYIILCIIICHTIIHSKIQCNIRYYILQYTMSYCIRLVSYIRLPYSTSHYIIY